MRQQWDKLEKFMAEKTPNVFDVLNDGIEAHHWKELEEKIGINLPQDFKDFYAIHNGLSHYEAPFFFSFGFLTQEHVIGEWEGWVEFLGEHTPEELVEDFDSETTSEMPEHVKAIYANKKWIPFAHDWGGNHIGLDLDPNPKGSVGQVINFGVDEDSKFVLADSFTEFINWLLKQIDDGNYIVKTSEDSDEVLYLKEPDLFFTDAARQLIMNK